MPNDPTNETTLDIKGTSDDPDRRKLSNFASYPFVLDGVPCASMEGLLQSLKTKNVKLQENVCLLSGLDAKNFFVRKLQNPMWKLTGILYWKGKPLRRTSDEYQYFLDRAYEALCKNPDFASALISTEGIKLTHEKGKHDTRETVLTEYEFLSRLEKCRERVLREARDGENC